MLKAEMSAAASTTSYAPMSGFASLGVPLRSVLIHAKVIPAFRNGEIAKGIKLVVEV